jgi:CRISPR-associated endonuclease/helicase Cas3
MIQMLNAMSKRYHIVIIVMSATLPKLDTLLKESETFTSLVKNKTYYFQNPLFRDRVKLNFDLLKKWTLSIEELAEWIIHFKMTHGKIRMLIELIKKKTARELYDVLRKRMQHQVIIELTGDDSRFIRKKVLDRLQGTDHCSALNDVIVVATQVIEAGVDIDMDVGMKDISLLDSEEQFLGRINRSALKSDSIAYFFNLDAADTIYKSDLRLEHDLQRPDYQDALLNKEFDQFYSLVFKRFLQIREKRGPSYRQFEHQLNNPDFEKISKELTLIEEKTYSLFLNFSVETGGGELSGEMVWENFKTLLKNNDLSYSEKKIKLSQISEQMDYFTFSSFQKPKIYDELIGNIYYIYNCSDFIEWDPQINTWKFRPDKYIEKSEDDFL